MQQDGFNTSSINVVFPCIKHNVKLRVQSSCMSIFSNSAWNEIINIA